VSTPGPADDVEAVKRLKYAYLRSLDLKLWDEFGSLFLPDSTGSYADLTFGSREELVDYMRANLPAGRITFHQAHHPEVDVRGDEATATWYLHDKVFVPELDVAVEGAAFYRDEMTRTAEGWRFRHVGYRRTFECSWRMSAVPGWSFRPGTAYDS
jgi:hypothetical protein